MASLLLIVIGIGAGFALKKSGRVSAAGVPRLLNALVLNVSLPALTLVRFHGDLPIEWLPASMAWIFYGLGVLILGAVSRTRRFDRATFGALLLTSALGNT